jgi:hypothetical protein
MNKITIGFGRVTLVVVLATIALGLYPMVSLAATTPSDPHKGAWTQWEATNFLNSAYRMRLEYKGVKKDYYVSSDHVSTKFWLNGHSTTFAKVDSTYGEAVRRIGGRAGLSASLVQDNNKQSGIASKVYIISPGSYHSANEATFIGADRGNKNIVGDEKFHIRFNDGSKIWLSAPKGCYLDILNCHDTEDLAERVNAGKKFTAKIKYLTFSKSNRKMFYISTLWV